MAVTQTVQHHHRSTTKSNNKPFKSRHATKSAIKEQTKGKVERLEKGTRRTPHQHVMSKIQRRNQAKQLRQNKNDHRREEGSIFNGRNGAPRIIAVIPLCDDVKTEAVVASLNESVDVNVLPTDPGSHHVEIPRFKQKIQYLTPSRSLISCLDACRVADYVLFVLSANEEVDERGEHLLRCVESQGISTVFTGVYALDVSETAKRRMDILKSLKSYITHFFPTQEKVHDFANRQDSSNLMRSLCTTIPKGIKWREDRSWMNIDSVEWRDSCPVITGVVRGRGLKADRLVQVGDWGDFMIDRIASDPQESRDKGAHANNMAIDTNATEQDLQRPSDDQDDLAELAPESVMEDLPATSIAPSDRRAVLLDDHHYFHDDEEEANLQTPQKLPRGTSKYQSAWFLGDMSDSGSDMEDMDDEMDDAASDHDQELGPADGHFDQTMREPTEGAPTEYPQSEAFFDRAPEDEAQQIESYRATRREEGDDDLEFPDEIELHPNVNARERLAKYRGLKSLRTSEWNTEEDKPYEPVDWTRLLEISDYRAAKNRILKETLTGGVAPGTRVRIYLRATPEQQAKLQALTTPTHLFSLLRHEHKHSVMNMSINLSSEHPAPVKSKETLIVQCGPRRLVINPLFSQVGNTPNNVHKFDRYLHPGRTAVVSFIGPVIWGSVPCLYFRQPSPSSDPVEDLAVSLKSSPSDNLELIAIGTSLAPSTDRIVAKRIVLTGHPYKIHKKLVTVRYMFFNNEDVEYFRALQLWTKRGRAGYIKETLGTHGYFKATFDGKINPLDAVAISLYKRVWPRTARSWSAAGVVDALAQGSADAEMS